MKTNIDKPYVLRVSELIYSKIFEIKKQNQEMSNIQAFEVFMTTKDFDLISSGDFHNQWFSELKENKYIDKTRCPSALGPMAERYRPLTISLF